MNGVESGLELSRNALCEREVSLKMDHETAVAHVRATLEDVGFRVVTDYSPSARIGLSAADEPGSYTVLGIEIPDVEDRVLAAADDRVGAIFPPSVSIWSDEPSVQRVYYLDRLRLAPGLGLVANEESWAPLVAQFERLIYDAFDALEADVDHR